MGSGGSAATGSYDYVISKIGNLGCDERSIGRAQPAEYRWIDDTVGSEEKLCGFKFLER